MTPIEASRATCVWRQAAHRCFKKGLAASWTADPAVRVIRRPHRGPGAAARTHMWASG